MRRVFGDAMISLGAVVVLLITLVSVDPRVRDQVSPLWGAQGSSAVTSISLKVRHVSSAALSAARDQSEQHAPLMIFALAATVLVLFMLRT
jgi:hypothetical protein